MSDQQKRHRVILSHIRKRDCCFVGSDEISEGINIRNFCVDYALYLQGSRKHRRRKPTTTTDVTRRPPRRRSQRLRERVRTR